MRQATPADTPAIYSLLRAVNFAHLPPYEEAAPILEGVAQLIHERDGKVAIWVNTHLHNGQEPCLDIAIAPEYRGKALTKGICKQVLTYALGLSHCGSVMARCYSPESVRLAVKAGFELLPGEDEPGWVSLRLTKEGFKKVWQRG